MIRPRLFHLSAAASMTLHALAAFSAPGDLIRISENPTTGDPGNASSFSSPNAVNRITANGRYLVFASGASNLIEGDGNETTDIYVYDAQSGAIELLSRAGAGGEIGNSMSFSPTISNDGRYVAFESNATNLGDGDPDSIRDIHVYDRANGTIELISRAGADGAKGNENSSNPSISFDGRFVAFQSSATNLGGDSGPHSNIYVYDRNQGRIELVSRAGQGGAVGDSNSANPVISADGRFVAFRSTASNFGDGDADTLSDIHVYDRLEGSIELVSRAGKDGEKGNSSSFDPSISADGRYIAFQSYASNFNEADQDDIADIHVYDRENGTIQLVSRAGANGAKGDGDSEFSSISASGRYVAFHSAASNLTPDDRDNIQDIFVYDLQAGKIHLMSRRADGTKGDMLSLYPALNADGSVLAFSSLATNLDGEQSFFQVFRKETSLINRPPVADAGPDQILEATSQAGVQVTLDASGSFDPDRGDRLDYAWSWPPSGKAVGKSPQVQLPLGSTTVTLRVSDQSGQSATDTLTVTVIDTTPPALTCPEPVEAILGENLQLGQATVKDTADPMVTLSNNAPSEYELGNTMVRWTATDASGNQASCEQKVQVRYRFEGFFPPLANPPVLNPVKAIRLVPVKWRLSDSIGHSITDTKTLKRVQYSASSRCNGQTEGLFDALSAGSLWNGKEGQFVYYWVTPNRPGQCVRLIMHFDDESVRELEFRIQPLFPAKIEG